MEKIEQILELWNTDSVIDNTEPGRELLNIPKLHNKYLQILVKHKMASKKAHFDYSKLRKIKEEYYNGSLSKEELEELGWEPFLLNIKTKQGIERYIESDKDLIRLLEKKLYHEEAISICESILQEVKNRTWEIRSFIDWERFVGGN
jgi:hypothetical protein